MNLDREKDYIILKDLRLLLIQDHKGRIQV
jgi:hypothetical protein